MQQYKYGSKLAQIYPGEVVVFSRLPVQRQQFANAAGRLVNIVDIEAGEETLRIIALHGHRPLVEEPDLYAKYWQAMDALLDSQPHPLVVIGDFNATQHSAVLKNLAAQGLRSAHSERGRGYATTWPNGVYPAPPIRIDHALLSAAVDCVEIVEGVGTGSDHRPLIVDVRVPRRSPAERLHQDP
jgi:endonuclease/exonuclease/phosphatase (EEP) superfamily protein YafD